MNRKFILLAGILLLTPKLRADDAKTPVDPAAYLEDLQLKLDHAAQRANQPSSEGSSVVGLRGSKQESGSKQLYWKGKDGAVPVSTAEVKELRAAIDLARAGNNEGAVTGLKTFLDKHPKSPFKHDAEQTLAKLTQPATPVPAATQATAAATTPTPPTPKL
jgi:TolA-binding protein